MNLRVNFIFEPEQRSGGMVSAKSLIRIAGMVIPVIIGLAIAFAVLGLLRVSRYASSLEQEWLDAEPRKEQAQKSQMQLQHSREILREINGWETSRMAWHEQLGGLATVTPPDIQIQSLRVSEQLKRNAAGLAVRKFTAVLTGKATGEQAESNVESLRSRLETETPFAGLTEAAEVVRYAADTTRDAQREDRVYEINFAYKPRPFK